MALEQASAGEGGFSQVRLTCHDVARGEGMAFSTFSNRFEVHFQWFHLGIKINHEINHETNNGLRYGLRYGLSIVGKLWTMMVKNGYENS